MKGIIIRIAVKNFVTYKSVEFWPGRNLNLIVGPNGTGKSTIVCAIVLGLGGKPKTVGRGSNVGSYVKDGCAEGSVEIELYNPDGQNYIIGRNIVRASNKTTWTLNGLTASQKQVDEVITKLNIQVDNLCQFLPQDRVQDFAKMDQKSLLENTEKTVGSAKMYDQHIQLKELRAKQLNMEKTIGQITVQLESEQQRNDRIAVQATNVSQKKTFLEEIYLLKQKRAWLKYDQMKGNVERMKEDTTLAQRSMKKHQQKCAPLQEQVAEAKRNIKKAQDKLNKCNEDFTKSGTALKEKQDQTEKFDDVLNDKEQEFRDKVEAENRRQEDCLKMQLEIDNLKNVLSQLNPKSDEGGKEEIRTVLNPQISKHVEQMRKYDNEKLTINTSLEPLVHEIHIAESEKEKANNVLNQRLEILHRKQNHVYRAIMWLRENKHKFRGKVHEPIMLEISVHDIKFAKVVEAAIPQRDLLAFVCEEKDDMDLLLKLVRNDMKLNINVLHSGSMHQASNDYAPRDRIESLRKYGFLTYIRELFTAPEAIMKYLCRNCYLHAIPLGDATVSSHTDALPTYLRTFYSEKESFNVTYSKYSKSKSTRSTEIGTAFYLANAINMDFLQSVEQKLQKLHNIRQVKNDRLSTLRELAKKEEAAIDVIRRRKIELRDQMDQHRTIQIRLNSKMSALKSIKLGAVDIEHLEAKHRKDSKQAVLEMCLFQEEVLKATKDFHAVSTDRSILQGEVLRVKDRTVKLQADMEEMVKQLRSAEALYQNISLRLNSAKLELKEYFTIAKELTDNICPTDTVGFQVFRESFQQLPENIDAIEKEIQSRQAKVDCIGNDSDDLLHEYEQRKKAINDLAVRIESQRMDADDVQAQIESVKQEWLPPLEELISKINERFGLSFQKVCCVGQVSLSKGENENDFHNYGLSIKVKFRDGEPLKQLNQYIQSGGERAVSTAIYMISLQELTHVPFRCVDEINQGMDPVNERMVFDLLVKTTSQRDTAQYFLLTPKLLPSLTYEKTMSVMCVNNGPHCLPHSQWELQKFRKKRQKMQ